MGEGEGEGISEPARRVPHLSTVQRRNIHVKEVIDAWQAYKDKAKEIPPTKVLEMKALVSSMV